MSCWLQIAREKFPLSAAAGRISGAGQYAIAMRCEAPRVVLFDSASRRLHAADVLDEQGCGAEQCKGLHRFFNLENE
jgi:hypothetical protein